MAPREDFAVSSDEVNWRTYLAEFHRERAGIAEAVLSRALAGDHSPYRWLARAVSATASTVLDLACGSGPMSRELALPGRTVIGLDLSEHELALAADRGPGPWIRADALQLPIQRRVHRCRYQLNGIGGRPAADPSCRGGGAGAAPRRSAGRDRPRNPAARPARPQGADTDQWTAENQAPVSGPGGTDRLRQDSGRSMGCGR